MLSLGGRGDGLRQAGAAYGKGAFGNEVQDEQGFRSERTPQLRKPFDLNLNEINQWRGVSGEMAGSDLGFQRGFPTPVLLTVWVDDACRGGSPGIADVLHHP